MLIILFQLSKIQNYMFLYQLYQQGTIKNYQDLLARNLNNQLFEMNIKQKKRMKIQQMDINIFSNQILLELADCLF